MYWFNETEKAKLLEGRTITYLATKKLNITIPYLTDVLNGKRSCSHKMAERIVKCLCWEAEVEDYFTRKEN